MARYPAKWRGSYYPQYERRERLQAKDGIAAKKKRGDIGETWWSRRFIQAMEALTDGGRLSRGRSYARSGQVMGLEIGAGIATAQVQGSRPRPYKVEIKVKTLSRADWQRADTAMAEEASFLARLLAGEMPQDIERAFEACKLSLFPAARGDLTTACSCPDWANPCKHVAATLYVLAERFDADPFLIFAWRGRTRDELLGRLREVRAAQESEPPAPISGEARLMAGPGTAAKVASPVRPLAACLDSFWDAAEGFDRLPLAHDVPGSPEALVAQLGPAPMDAFGRNLAEWLVPVYQAMAEGARERLGSE